MSQWKTARFWMVLCLAAMLFFAAPASQVLADSSGPRYPGSGINLAGAGTILWSNPANISADDAVIATVELQKDEISQGLLGTGFGFTIPAEATITGIQVDINRYDLAGGNPKIRDASVRLVKAGVASGNDKGDTAANWPSTVTSLAEYGSSTDLWGETWTPADINDVNFGVVLSVTNPSNNARTGNVDFFSITVTFTLPSTTGAACGGGSVILGGNISCTATVTRSGGTSTPSGLVSWSSDAAGSFSSPQCSLSGADGIATCSVTYTPSEEGDGSHLITATYNGDANFAGSTGSTSLTVLPNLPPSITSNGGGSTATVSIAEGTTAVTDAEATDPESATLTFSLNGGADQGKFTINPSTGVLAFISAPDFEHPTDVGSNNVYDVVLQVSDGYFADTQAIAVTVTNVNDPPVISGADPRAVTMSEDGSPTPFSLTLDAVDDSPTLTWSILVQAANGTATASGTGTSKQIGYTPNNHFNGTDSFTVQVTDGELADTVVVNVTVQPVADIFYVDNTNPAATDASSNPGTDPSKPLLTVIRGAFYARAGDTVNVLAGTYNETVFVLQSGRNGYPITFHANPSVTMRGSGVIGSGAAFSMSGRSYIVIDGFHITQTAFHGIFVNLSNHITISNNHVSYSGQDAIGQHNNGIILKETTDSTIINNITDHNYCTGIYLGKNSDNNLISKNISFANAAPLNPVPDAAGIQIDGSHGNNVIHNITYGNEDSGINFYVGATGNFAVGNLVYGNRDHGIDVNGSPSQVLVSNTIQGNYTSGINLEASSGDITIANNILADNGLAPEEGRKAFNINIDTTSTTDTTMDYNLYFLSPPYLQQIKWNGEQYYSLAAFKTAHPSLEVHGLEGDPLFEDPADPATAGEGATGGDYHLTVPSPAIDSANSSAPSQPAQDIEGTARVDYKGVVNTGAGIRTYDDRGAYEFTGLVPTSLTAASASGAYGSSINLSATITPQLSGKTISFKLNGTTACSGTTNSSGVATCSTQLLADIGSYPTGVSATFAGDTDYAQSSDTAQLTVTARHITGSFTAGNKTYDGTTTATVLTRSLTGVISGDTVSLSGGAAAFGNENVANGKTVTLTGAVLSGADMGNYILDSVSTATANITPRDLTVTATGVNKVFDGTTTATVVLSDNRLAGDMLTASYTSANFANALVGQDKTVTVTGISISGTDSVNYHLVSTTTTTTADILAKMLSLYLPVIRK